MSFYSWREAEKLATIRNRCHVRVWIWPLLRPGLKSKQIIIQYSEKLLLETFQQS